MTLLLGPPGSGKTTLLQALAGKRDKDLRVCHFLLPLTRTLTANFFDILHYSHYNILYGFVVKNIYGFARFYLNTAMSRQCCKF
jgi:ABC-type hemin transport system ATPase subunit